MEPVGETLRVSTVFPTTAAFPAVVGTAGTAVAARTGCPAGNPPTRTQSIRRSSTGSQPPCQRSPPFDRYLLLSKYRFWRVGKNGIRRTRLLASELNSVPGRQLRCRLDWSTPRPPEATGCGRQRRPGAP